MWLKSGGIKVSDNLPCCVSCLKLLWVCWKSGVLPCVLHWAQNSVFVHESIDSQGAFVCYWIRMCFSILSVSDEWFQAFSISASMQSTCLWTARADSRCFRCQAKFPTCEIADFTPSAHAQSGTSDHVFRKRWNWWLGVTV